jgi:Protein of unknown function (DUF3631)
VIGSLILDDVVRTIRRFVVMSDTQADATALWVAHTHVIEAFDATGYYAVTSAVMRSGKSRLLEVLELLTREPLPAANLSDAVLFRVIEARKPTLLLDEADAIFGRKAREREELRGMLNAGWRRGTKAYRMGGKNVRTLETFEVFCAKAFAGIGDYLPDTLVDRSIVVRLDRRTRAEPVERFRRREVEPTTDDLRDRLADWLEPQLDGLRAARPQLPQELDDRAWDCWEPLLAVADLAGGEWPSRARAAAVELSSGEAREEEGLSIRLLGDVQQVFETTGADRIKTSVLLSELAAIEESPWGDWYGRPLSPPALGKLLKPYRIRTMAVWVEGETARGFKREQFVDAWERYLSCNRVRSSRGVRSEAASEAGPIGPIAPNAGTPAGLDTPAWWLARDGRWRSVEMEPWHFPGEVVETADAPPSDGQRELF